MTTVLYVIVLAHGDHIQSGSQNLQARPHPPIDAGGGNLRSEKKTQAPR